MMEISIKINPSPEHLAASMTRDVAKAVRAGMIHLVTEIEARAKKAAPVKTSNLVRMITSDVSRDGRVGIVNAGADYSLYVHEGTGLYGPKKKKITPKTKKALHWAGARHPVKSVKGMKGRPFFREALDAIDAQDIFSRAMAAYMRKKT